MSEHTKGPWTAELGEIHEVRDVEGGRVCILTQLRGRHGLGGRRPDTESSANACLIAAAPEMAEMLLKISRSLWRDFDSSDGSTDTMDTIDALLKKAGVL